MKKQNKCLNFFKGLACILVVSLHVRFPVEAIDGPVQCLARFSVPLFFVISGFYCYYESNNVYLQKIPKKIRHIFQICVVSFGFWIAMNYAVSIFGADKHNIKELTQGIFSWNTLVRFILLNEDPIISILWFLLALLYCYVIYYLGARTNKLRIFPKLVAPLLFLHLLLGNIGNGILNWKIDVELYRNVWLMGFPLFTLGHELRAKQNVILDKISSSSSIVLMILGLVLTLAEWSLIGGRQQMYIGSILMAGSCIIYSMWNPEKKVIGVVSYVGEKLSLYVYVLHISVGIVIDKMAKIVNISNIFGYQCIRPTLVIISTIIVAAVLDQMVRISRK